MIAANGCWADYRLERECAAGRPCLFLDRDGVLIEDTGYPHDAGTIIHISEGLDLVCAANRLSFVTGIVSNQSGIGRGYFDWDAFAAVQRAIDAMLTARGGRLDFVLACPHIHEAVRAEHRVADHPWRKPAPGMMLAAAEHLRLDLPRSAMVGDRASDMTAATAASIGHRILVDGVVASGSHAGAISVTRNGLLACFAAFLD